MNLVKAKWQSFTLSSGILPLAARVKGLWACLRPEELGLGVVDWFIVAAALKKIKNKTIIYIYIYIYEFMFK